MNYERDIMIRAWILFYLNIKPTHGYEIQRFFQISGTEQWAKIQSGSIYYALSKLEKEKFIKVVREERTGSRIRKVYGITESGKEELKKELKIQMAAPISNIGSMKFLISPLLCELTQEEIAVIVNRHIMELKEELAYWNKWRKAKISEFSTRLEALSFDYAIHSLEDQIEWHGELVGQLDTYIKQGMDVKNYIKAFDFSEINPDITISEDDVESMIDKIKEEFLKNPKNAAVNVKRMLEELKNQ